MNIRSCFVSATAFAAAAGILLTGCGEDGESKDDKIAGARKGDTTSASPTAQAPDEADRPKTTFPKGVKNEFEGWKTGDKTKDAVLADVSQTVNAVDYAILKGDANSPTVSYYRQGEAAASASKWIQAWLDEDLTFVGTTRYYAPKVQMSGKNSAGVVYCADESKAFNKNRKTGKVDKSPSGESPYVLYNTRLQKSGKGVWQTTKVLSKRGDKSCA
ncbi:hypothetical protein [Streptomyces sp. NPDC047108]|uniref:hypothetical protein n=1 Tax=Streptomyces sp. NPDC047108 TaxID=3155025 RepID=UPI0033CFCB22